MNLMCREPSRNQHQQHTQLVRVVAQLIADTTKPDSQIIIQFCDGPGSGSGPELDNGQWKVIIERMRFEVCLHFHIHMSLSLLPVCACEHCEPSDACPRPDLGRSCSLPSLGS